MYWIFEKAIEDVSPNSHLLRLLREGFEPFCIERWDGLVLLHLRKQVDQDILDKWVAGDYP